FASMEWEITGKTGIVAGVRYSNYDQLGPDTVYTYMVSQPITADNITGNALAGKGSIQSYAGFEPRLSLRQNITTYSSLKLSYSRLFQYIHSVSNTFCPTPIDFWQLSTTYIPPQRSDSFSLGYFKNSKDNNLTFFPNPFNQPPPDCYVFGFPDPERITLLNGDQFGGSAVINTQIVAKRIIDESFLSRHYFNVRQTSISKSAYEYWRKVRELVNNTGSVFDTPPAPIYGNVSNVDDDTEVVLGYFEVARVAQTRMYTTRADVPYFEPEVCTFSPTRPYEDYPKTC